MKKRKVQSVIFYCDADQNKHFLLLRVNKKRGLFWQNSTGSVEENESFQEAAIREAIEETALTKNNLISIDDANLDFKFKDQWGFEAEEKVFYLKCKELWKVELDPTEHSEYKWVNQKDFSSSFLKFETNSKAVLKCMEEKC